MGAYVEVSVDLDWQHRAEEPASGGLQSDRLIRAASGTQVLVFSSGAWTFRACLDNWFPVGGGWLHLVGQLIQAHECLTQELWDVLLADLPGVSKKGHTSCQAWPCGCSRFLPESGALELHLQNLELKGGWVQHSQLVLPQRVVAQQRAVGTIGS